MKVTIGDKTYKIAFQHLPTRTICWIMLGDDTPLWTGCSRLHPNDNYCKETGRKLSLARALQASGFAREERKLFWAAYRYRAVPFAPEPTSSPRREDATEGGAAV